jgi:hypothetical protein
MICNIKLLFVFLIVALIIGCEKKEEQSIQIQTVDNVSIMESSEIYEEAGYEEILQEEPIYDEPVEVAKVGIILKRELSIYDRIEYVERNVTGLYFFKIPIIGIEGLGQLEFLDTIVFVNVADIEDFSFLTEVPRLKRLFIDYNTQNIDWGFIEQLPDLEVLYVDFFLQPTISIDLKNNRHLEYIGFTSGVLETFPTLLNVPNSLKYLNLGGNKITTLPPDIGTYAHATVLLGLNPFRKDATTPSNITVESANRVFGQTYSVPNDIPLITGIRD